VRCGVAVALLSALPSREAHAQVNAQVNSPRADTRREILTGRVTTDTGMPLRGAVIIATMAPDRVIFRDSSDANGIYRITVAEGSGDYLLHISALGHTAFRKRVIRAATDSMYVVDAALAPMVAQLATVRVASRRPTPSRITESGIEPGASERVPDALNGALPPDQAGDLAALASLTPGASPVAGGYSVLGLGAAQNNQTINGMAFAGAGLPRDVRATSRVSTSTFDPARGWFSGSNVNMELAGGGLFGSSRGRVSVDAPALQLTDPASASTGQRFSSVRASYGADGPVTWENKHFYNVGVQADRRSSHFASLMTADPRLLARVGVAPDSAARLVEAMRFVNAPVTSTAIPGAHTTDNVSFIARLERTPTDMKTLTPVKVTYGVLAFGALAHDRAININALGTPGRGRQSSQQSGGVQGVYSRFLKKDYLNETRTSLSVSDRHETSLLDVPEGHVLVQSAFEDDAGALTMLSFGGSGAGNRRWRQLTWETTNTTKFYANGRSAHRVKVTSDVRYDGYRYASLGMSPGAFTYAALADVEANRPVAFTRTLTTPTREGGEWNAFASISDYWRVSPTLQVVYGARVEGNAFIAPPAFNPELERALDARTDYAPNTVHASPRLGFTWLRAAATSSSRNGALGQYAVGPTRYLRGGIGEFRGMIAPTLLSEARVATGLPGAATRLSCIGDATPTPDWLAYQSDARRIPLECVGPRSSAFIDTAPDVRLIGPGYRPPTSWRANLVYGSTALGVDWSIEGLYSLNLHQPGTVDLNFRAAPVFMLAGEARPVFVPASSILSSTGAVSPVAARGTSSFGRVVSAQSDLRSVSRQLTLAVRPSPDLMRNWYLSAAYTLADVRASTRGFEGTTFGSPTERSWARGDFDPRHQLLAQLGFTWNGISVAGLTRVQSGLAFTPTIASDVNGDGLVNDRAMIFDPATTEDGQLAAGMRELLASSSGSLSRCLRSQLGQAAARNSCESPWTVTLNAQVSVTHPRLQAIRVSEISMNFANPLAGLDQLVHGAEGLRGWGAASIPDPTLHAVRSFDAGARQFRYTVNPRFGRALPASTLWRAPFRMTLEVSMNLGKPIAVQQLNQWLKPGRAGHTGKRLTAAELKKRYERNVPDPFDLVLQNADSLLVNRAQVEALTRAQPAYRLRMDSVWTSLAADLAALGDQYDDAAALKRQEAAMDQGWEITRVAVHTVVAPILNRVQLGLLPGWVAALYRTDKPAQYRMYLAAPAR
jgi:hypothetical protein